MKKIKHLMITFFIKSKRIFKVYRIKKYGLAYVLDEWIILICHRNNSNFEHYFTKRKDDKIDKYLKKHYSDIIERYY